MLGRFVFGALALFSGLLTIGGLATMSQPDGSVGGVIFSSMLTLLFGWLTFRKKKPRNTVPDGSIVQRADGAPITPTPTNLLTARGFGGTMTFDGREVVITRNGALAFVIHGLAGEKTILLNAIQGVQLRKPGGGVRGYLQLSVLGGTEARRGAISAANDENSVLFDPPDLPAFERIAAAIKNALHERHSPASAAQVTPQSSMADELSKLAALRDSGAITEAEFTAMKAKLLT